MTTIPYFPKLTSKNSPNPMSKFRKILIFELIILSLFLLTYCNETKKKKAESKETEITLGNAYLEVTGLDEARPHFEKGLLLLHSFEYRDAEDAFVEAQSIDPNMAMAYWGEAMTYNHGLWRGQDYEKGVAALNKLGAGPTERALKTGSELEKDLLQSVELLYGEGTKFERDQSYSNYLGDLYEKYPDNMEVAAFYALSLLGSVQEGRNDETYEKGAIVAQGILKENPNHPGALHYLIHSYDDPYNAYKALEAADSYSAVAKDAGHALHMPSHIYVALGMWEEVVSSNEASYQASLDRKERKGLDNNARGYHAFHWLMYGYLQQGRYKDARRLLEEMNQYTVELPSRRARDYLIHMTGTYLVETKNWNDELRGTEVDQEKLNISVRTMYGFIRGMSALTDGNIEEAARISIEMTKDRKIAIGRMENRSVAGCGGSWKFDYPNQVDIDQSNVIGTRTASHDPASQRI